MTIGTGYWLFIKRNKNINGSIWMLNSIQRFDFGRINIQNTCDKIFIEHMICLPPFMSGLWIIPFYDRRIFYVRDTTVEL